MEVVYYKVRKGDTVFAIRESIHGKQQFHANEGTIVGHLTDLNPKVKHIEGLFVDLPWGRWPLTIHSAAWGLAFNLLIVLLASAVTLRAPDAFRRGRLHDALFQATGLAVGGRGLLWALMLLWSFLAYGPGAVLGNTFFSHPVFTEAEAALGIPSLWVWQILFWLLGVVLVWWLAFRIGLGRTSDEGIKVIELEPDRRSRPPDWLAAGLSRVNGRSD